MGEDSNDAFLHRDSRTYRLTTVFHSPSSFEVKILLETIEIGRASVGLDTPERARLYDINLYSEKGLQHRSLGLGAELLHMAMTQAQSLGAKEMIGSVIRTDLEAKPDLLDWYARHGFVILEERDQRGNVQVFVVLRG